MPKVTLLCRNISRESWLSCSWSKRGHEAICMQRRTIINSPLIAILMHFACHERIPFPHSFKFYLSRIQMGGCFLTRRAFTCMHHESPWTTSPPPEPSSFLFSLPLFGSEREDLWSRFSKEQKRRPPPLLNGNRNPIKTRCILHTQPYTTILRSRCYHHHRNGRKRWWRAIGGKGQKEGASWNWSTSDILE